MSDYDLPFDPQLLAAFLAVSDRGGVSAAGHALSLSQPAVTAQIRRLEEQLGTRLFERRPRGMALTEGGRQLREAAEQARERLAEAARGLSRASAPRGLLTIWASTTIASYVLPPLLARFAEEHRQVRLRLVSANTQEVIEAVRSGQVELGLVEGHGRAAGLRLPVFVEDELIAVAHPSFVPRRAGLPALFERPVLWRERGSGTRAVIERSLREAGARLEKAPRFELASTEAIKSAAAAGLGIAFLSRWSMVRELALGVLVPVPGRGLTARRTFRWALAGGGLGGLARLFYDYANRRKPLLPGS